MPSAQKNRLSQLFLLAAVLAAPSAQAGFFDDLFGIPSRPSYPTYPQPQPEEPAPPVVMGKPKPVVVGPFSSVTNAANLGDLLRLSLQGKGSLKIGKQPQYVVKDIAQRLYSLRNFQPLFVDMNGLTPVGQMMRKILVEESANKGLSASFYWSSDAESRLALRDVKSLGELDLLMTIAYLQYANDTATGRTNPQDASQNIVDIEYKKRSFNSYAFLNEILASPEALYAGLQSLEPKHPIYQKMVTALTRLQATKKSGGWPKLVSDKQLKVGSVSKNVPAIRARLFDLGMLPEGVDRNDPNPTYDAVLEAGVKNFQTGQKKSADGLVGPNTLNALDTSIDARIRQLQVNIERWRLMPVDLGQNYIFVDLGRQHMRLVQNGQETLSMKTVVGQTLRQTPSFPDEIGYLIVNPYWFAPGSIVVKDILPQVMQDPSYFSQLGMKILENGRELDPYEFDADYWSQFTVQNPPPYTFREDPGPNNSLGRIKFQLLKNKHDIYMHDTNHRELFGNLLRANSSGCIRLELPVELADRLLQDQRIDKNMIDGMIADSTVVAKKIQLTTRMPVFVMGTTIALSGSNLLFGPDIYGQDKRIMDALNGLRIVPTESTINFFGERDSTL
ncbi:MAG: murein L,D-transpeptidase [Bacteriovoracia bacterium]